jgi:integrase
VAHSERPTYTAAIPATARRVVERGVEYAVWTDRKGQPVKAPVLASGKCRRTVRQWIGVYRDAAGVRRKTRPYSSRDAALSAAIQLERHGKAVRDGTATPDSPADGRTHLVDFLADYLAHLAAEGDSPKHVARVGASLRTSLSRLGITTAGSVNATAVMRLLEADRKAGDPRGKKRGGKPLSIRTRNKRVGELRSFGRWLAAGRIQGNPFAALQLANAETDRRRVRRAISVAEFARLIEAAGRSAESVKGLSGADRRACYVLAAYTGLRASALAQLTPEAFTWAGDLPTAVYSSARLQKNRSAHGVPLAESAGRELASWLRSRPAGQPLFGRRRRWSERAAEMLACDLGAAGIPVADATGAVFDFHSLRLQFGYLLASSGVPLVAAQQLLDHSTPTLTANIYSRFGGELAGEVAKLPSLGPSLGPDSGGQADISPPGGAEKPDGETKKPRRKARKS